MNKLPKSKTQNIVVQEFGKEVLIYDVLTNKACALNEIAAIVYRACDGKTTFAELTKTYGIREEMIHFSLEQLNKENLLIDAPVNYFAGLTRREVIRKIGMTSVMALPVISVVVAPMAISAQSCTPSLGQPCTFSNFTQSDCCASSLRCSNALTPNFCAACYSSGSPYASAPGFATPVFCDAQSSKNLCCNAGSATGDGNTCFCP